MLLIPRDTARRDHYVKHKVRFSRLQIYIAHRLARSGLREILKERKPKGIAALCKEIRLLSHYIHLLKKSEGYYKYLRSIHKHSDYERHLKERTNRRSR